LSPASIDLSVVLPCRNQGDHIEAVLRSYAGPLRSTALAYEIIVVPNAPLTTPPRSRAVSRKPTST